MLEKIKIFLCHKNFIAASFGAFMALAFAPIYFFIAAIISLSALYLLLERTENKKTVFLLGFFFGFGHFLAGIYWISISLLVDAAHFAWLIPFALILIPSALAIYLGLFALSYHIIIKKLCCNFAFQKIFIFACCWLIFEILRANLFTGFPWNLIGYAWMFDLHFAQLAAIFGIYGLSFLAVLIALMPVLFYQKKISFFDKIFAGIIFMILISSWIFGYYHIDEKKLIFDSKTKIRLVQANIKQEMKWDENEKYKNLLKHIELTNSKDLSEVMAVIWSETSVPYVIDDNDKLLQILNEAMPNSGILITGGLRLNYLDLEKSQIADVWNSIFVINHGGIKQHYDKHHLVPFGEYVPLQKFLPFIDKITGGGVGFSEGNGVKTLLTENFSFSPLLCYEVIFSDKILDKKNHPDLLINLTNDAWFGISSGPYQHFDMARMRAIEYGTALIRVAGTGITAMIDPFGRVVKKINLNEMGIIDVDLIKNNQITIYEKNGCLPLILLIISLFIIIVTLSKSCHKLKLF
jgi:apolipoprotein N-acyltransferase